MPRKGWASRFAGVWKDNRSAEEIVEDIRAARTANTFDVELWMITFDEILHTFAQERAKLWKAGKKIEDFDLLIGCAAKAKDLTIVTHNRRHFEHIEGLQIEDWALWFFLPLSSYVPSVASGKAEREGARRGSVSPPKLGGVRGGLKKRTVSRVQTTPRSALPLATEGTQEPLLT